MLDDRDLTALLGRPAVVAAVLELGVSALQVEDVLTALRRFGPVRIEVTADRRRPYACVLQVAGEDPEIGRGTSVLHAALSCWAITLESFSDYTNDGVTRLERFSSRTTSPEASRRSTQSGHHSGSGRSSPGQLPVIWRQP